MATGYFEKTTIERGIRPDGHSLRERWISQYTGNACVCTLPF